MSFYKLYRYTSCDYFSPCCRVDAIDGLVGHAYELESNRSNPGVSNIRPAGHNPARQAFLSGPQSLCNFVKI